MLKQLLVLCFVLYLTGANILDALLEESLVSPKTAPLAAPAIPGLPLPVSLPMFHKPGRNCFLPHGARKLIQAPSQPPNYGHLTTSIHPPSSSRLSKLSLKKRVPSNVELPPPGLSDIAPSQSRAGTIPASLAQPPLSPYASSKIYVTAFCLLFYDHFVAFFVLARNQLEKS